MKQQLYDRLQLSPAQIETVCQQWHITELALFGSVLRDDFRPDSDVDVLVTFAPDAAVSLLDLVELQHQLATLLVERWM
jgi:predicted nucleotidyltransferase